METRKKREEKKKKKISKRYSRRKKPLARRRLPVLAGSCCVAAAYYVCAYGMSISHNIRPGHTRMVGKTKSRATCVKHNFFFFLRKAVTKFAGAQKIKTNQKATQHYVFLVSIFSEDVHDVSCPKKKKIQMTINWSKKEKGVPMTLSFFFKSNSHFLLLFKRI